MPVLREVPPWTTVLEILALLNLPSEIPYTFQKGDISLENKEQAADLLYPYYIPCKAKQFLDHTDEVKWITILRHILLPQGYVILRQETTRQKKKAIFYTIERMSVIEGPLKSDVKVDFS